MGVFVFIGYNMLLGSMSYHSLYRTQRKRINEMAKVYERII